VRAATLFIVQQPSLEHYKCRGRRQIHELCAAIAFQLRECSYICFLVTGMQLHKKEIHNSIKKDASAAMKYGSEDVCANDVSSGEAMNRTYAPLRVPFRE